MRLSKISSIKHIQSLSKQDGFFVIGRTDALNKLFQSNQEIELKRLNLPNNDWDKDLNNLFINDVINDLDRGKPVYACIDIKIADKESRQASTSHFSDYELITQFHYNFVMNLPAGEYYSVYAIEMSQILSLDVTIEKFKTIDNIMLFEIKKCDRCIESTLTNGLKRLLNTLVELRIKTPTITRQGGNKQRTSDCPAPKQLRGSALKCPASDNQELTPHIGMLSSITWKRPTPDSKVLVGRRWRNQHHIKVGKRKSLAVVKYNGLYVPASFVEWMSKRK